MLGNALPHVVRIGVGRLHDDRAAVRPSPSSGLPLNKAVVSLSTTRSTYSNSLCSMMCLFGNRQIIRRRQAFLFRAVFRIRLHIFAEHVAADRGDDFVRGHRAEAADAVAAHRKCAGSRKSGSSVTFSAKRMIDAHAEVILAVVDHVFDHGDDVAGPHVAAAQSGGAGIDLRNPLDLLLAVLAGDGIAKRRLDFARQVIAGRRQRIVHPLQHAERLAMLQCVDNLPRRERAEAAHVQAADFNAARFRAGNRPWPRTFPCSSPCRR